MLLVAQQRGEGLWLPQRRVLEPHVTRLHPCAASILIMMDHTQAAGKPVREVCRPGVSPGVAVRYLAWCTRTAYPAWLT